MREHCPARVCRNDAHRQDLRATGHVDNDVHGGRQQDASGSDRVVRGQDGTRRQLGGHQSRYGHVQGDTGRRAQRHIDVVDEDEGGVRESLLAAPGNVDRPDGRGPHPPAVVHRELQHANDVGQAEKDERGGYTAEQDDDGCSPQGDSRRVLLDRIAIRRHHDNVGRADRPDGVDGDDDRQRGERAGPGNPIGPRQHLHDRSQQAGGSNVEDEARAAVPGASVGPLGDINSDGGHFDEHDPLVGALVDARRVRYVRLPGRCRNIKGLVAHGEPVAAERANLPVR